MVQVKHVSVKKHPACCLCHTVIILIIKWKHQINGKGSCFFYLAKVSYMMLYIGRCNCQLMLPDPLMDRSGMYLILTTLYIISRISCLPHTHTHTHTPHIWIQPSQHILTMQQWNNSHHRILCVDGITVLKIDITIGM